MCSGFKNENKFTRIVTVNVCSTSILYRTIGFPATLDCNVHKLMQYLCCISIFLRSFSPRSVYKKGVAAKLQSLFKKLSNLTVCLYGVVRKVLRVASFVNCSSICVAFWVWSFDFTNTTPTPGLYL